ncbi:MAG: aminotransferase class V-fold PLP-dependent enzyme [Bdellovibrionales bacterium]
MNFSHVRFNTGRCTDIRAIGEVCRERNILFVVDVSQSFGGPPYKEEIEYCDVIVGATYKWVLGPYGHAFAYWSERALKEIGNIHISWQSVKSGADTNDLLNYSMDTLPGARVFDRGQAPNVVTMSILSKSLELLEEVGLKTIEDHNQKLVNFFIENYPKSMYEFVTPIGEHKNILCLKTTSGIDTLKLEESLSQNGIDISVREGNLRLSFHLFNTKNEVETLLKALSE